MQNENKLNNYKYISQPSKQKLTIVMTLLLSMTLRELRTFTTKKASLNLVLYIAKTKEEKYIKKALQN